LTSTQGPELAVRVGGLAKVTVKVSTPMMKVTVKIDGLMKVRVKVGALEKTPTKVDAVIKVKVASAVVKVRDVEARVATDRKARTPDPQTVTTWTDLQTTVSSDTENAW
jgi:hypothetical protein